MSELGSYTPSLDISHDGTNLLILIKRARWKCFPNTCEIRCRINRSGSFVLVAHQTICLKETDSINKQKIVFAMLETQNTNTVDKWPLAKTKTLKSKF